jgi:hypothetical protein
MKTRLFLWSVILGSFVHLQTAIAGLAPVTLAGLTINATVTQATGNFVPDIGHTYVLDFEADGNGVQDGTIPFTWFDYSANGDNGGFTWDESIGPIPVTFTFLAATNGTFLYAGGTSGTQSGTFAFASSTAAPTIASQPQGQAVSLGANAAFSVVAGAGTPPLDYQWWFNGGMISGATSSSYAITNVQPTNAGDYFVVITNFGGAVTSALAVLTVATNTSATGNQVLFFDGGGYVTIQSAADLQTPAEITVEAWIYPNSAVAGYQPFISKSDFIDVSSSRSSEMVWTPNGGNSGPGSRVEVNFFVGASNWALVGAPANGNAWTHVAATYRSSDGLHQLYTNGVLAASYTTDADGVTPLAGEPLRQTTLPLLLGGSPLESASGYMDEVRVWSRALSADEIAADFSCPMVGASGLAAYWNFDDGTADDLTGNGNNGALGGDAEIEPISGPDVIHAGCYPAATLGVSVAAGLPFLSVSGKVGTAYRIQYANQLAEANWATLVSITLPTSPFIFSDSSLGTNATRFYRAVTP